MLLADRPGDEVRYVALPPAPLDEIREWLFLASSIRSDIAIDYRVRETVDHFFDVMRADLQEIARPRSGS